jgi:hypothetical protein
MDHVVGNRGPDGLPGSHVADADSAPSERELPAEQTPYPR